MIVQNSCEEANDHKQIKGGQWSYLGGQEQPDAPRPRFNHSSFIYKGKMYIHGGSTISSALVDDQLYDLYCFSLEDKTWAKLHTYSICKQFQLITNYSWASINNKFYTFGGTNALLNSNNLLWKLNLDTLEWTRVEQHGEIPSPREFALMQPYDQAWLVLYGGVNRNELEIYNTFHFFCLQTKNWFRCVGNYQHLVHPRCQPGLCTQQGVLFLFGGQYRNLQEQEKYLNDLYKVEVHIHDKSTAPQVTISRIVVNVSPPARSAHLLLPLYQQYLLVIGGQKHPTWRQQKLKESKLQTLNDVWIYNIEHSLWVQLQVAGSFFKNRTAFSSCEYNQSIYIFGGLMNYKKILDDIMVFSLNGLDLYNEVFVTPKLSCKMCQQNPMVFKQSPISATFIDQIVNEIQFPFAAIGLLIENAYSMTATYFNIDLQENDGQKYYVIEDNAKIWNTEELKPILINFQSNIDFMYGIDKKIRHSIQKQNQRRQYGTNMKLGALRLGSELLFLSNYNNEEMRIFLLKKDDTTEPQCYKNYFYAYNLASHEIIMGSTQTKNAVQKQYQKYINKIVNNNKVCNTLFIFNLRTLKSGQGYEELQLHPSSNNSDIIYGDNGLIANLEHMGYLMCECIDVSLRAYISSLFIKNNTMCIFLGVLGERMEVITQMYLQNIDRLCKSNMIMQIQEMVSLDCKIIQLYWNPDISNFDMIQVGKCTPSITEYYSIITTD